jgi:hypothetical protein
MTDKEKDLLTSETTIVGEIDRQAVFIKITGAQPFGI